MPSNSTDNSFSEKMLRQAYIEHEQRETEQVFSNKNAQNQLAFSAGHEARMKSLFKKDERNIRLQKVTRILKYSAAAVALALSFLFVVTLFNPDVYAAVRNVFYPPEQAYECILGYIPQGFTKTNDSFTDGVTEIEYSGPDEGMIRINVWQGRSIPPDLTGYIFDHENLFINGINYLIYDAAADPSDSIICSYVWWIHGDFTFMIRSTLSAGEIMEITLSIK